MRIQMWPNTEMVFPLTAYSCWHQGSYGDCTRTAALGMSLFDSSFSHVNTHQNTRASASTWTRHCLATGEVWPHSSGGIFIWQCCNLTCYSHSTKQAGAALLVWGISLLRNEQTAAFWQLLNSRSTLVATFEDISVHSEMQPHSLPYCEAKYSIQLKTEADANRDPTLWSPTSLILASLCIG